MNITVWPFKRAETTNDGLIIANGTVAVQLDEVIAHQFKILQRIRAFRDAGISAPFAIR
jgi:hypothetical protein